LRSRELKVDESLEALKKVDDPVVVGRQQLHQNDGRNLVTGIDPEMARYVVTGSSSAI
jgi:hypothetical protein